LANSREKTEGSLLSGDQVIVTEPPDEGFWEVTAKFDSAEATERKKRTLDRKESEKKRTERAKREDKYLRTRAGCIRMY
jgi:hypothetical protein